MKQTRPGTQKWKHKSMLSVLVTELKAYGNSLILIEAKQTTKLLLIE